MWQHCSTSVKSAKMSRLAFTTEPGLVKDAKRSLNVACKVRFQLYYSECLHACVRFLRSAVFAVVVKLTI